MQWNFFKNNGGQESGFHDAGVETFKGNLERYLAREIIQNSLDARDDQKKPVLVKFELLQLATSELPDIKSLVATFKRCADYWPQDKKAKDFFERAEVLAKAKKVVALKVGDYNTKGVAGTDTDREKGWYNLIRCSGSSAKWAGEGGSFGIGKSAPFAASRLRVVLYSSLTTDKKLAFQGVARLVSHKLQKSSDTAQPIGYLGDKSGASIRNKKEIPSEFQRAKTGTDLFILGYDSSGTWKKDLIYSVLENFWPAIYFADLEVEIEDIKITKKNLPKLLDDYRNEPEFVAHLYYKAFTDDEAKEIEETLPTLKKVRLNLLVGDGLPKRIAMIRRTGMIIYYHRFQSPLPFCGVFLCRNTTGNALLRDMEPPRHDDWNPNHPEKNAHRKTASEFTEFIRDGIRQLSSTDKEKVLAIPELANWLPDDEDSADESFDGESPSKKESFVRQSEEKKVAGRKMSSSRRQMQPDETHPGDGDMDTEIDGIGEGTGGHGEDGGGGGGGGHGGGGGGTDDGSAGPQTGKNEGKNAKPAIPIRGRVFVSNVSSGTYRVIAQPIKPVKHDVLLSIKAIGDDATGSMIKIADACIEGGKAVGSPRPGVVGPVKFSGKGALVLSITLVEPRKLAMEVEAHAAE